jgi:hypothetical protein
MWPFRQKTQKNAKMQLDSVVGGMLHAIASAHHNIQASQAHRLDIYFDHRCGNCDHRFHTTELDFNAESPRCPECDSTDTRLLVPKTVHIALSPAPDSPVMSVPLLTLAGQSDFALEAADAECSIEVSELTEGEDGADGQPAGFEVTVGPSRSGERPHDVLVMKMKFERQELREGVQKTISFFERVIDAIRKD